MFTKLKVWFISLLTLLNTNKTAPSAAKEEKLLKLDLQFFADDEDPDGDPDEDLDADPEEDPDDDTPDLEELLKNPKFKKQFTTKTKGIVSKRMKKFEGIDPEELRQLKEKAGKKSTSEEDPDKKDSNRDAETDKRLLRAERREKTALVKEFAIDNGYNPKLAARLMKVDAIELDEDGNAENLEELFEELEEEFPEYFGPQDEADDEEEKQPKKKATSIYNSGPRQQKGNKKPPKVDPREAGRLKALERHKKKEG
ncbi:hypothetical protein [Domibacillus enclensis]|uniref:Uncharacterized protein n=1 Tax=Domibacillus enclensis TaxID=1017273 RepID=A0A1N6WJ71_9BACI|nr:hypothetical protein [Domibacillus enclensis]OXS77949.1 hypothetical protein B1B05_10105 [Domibacillus enclensis]SIQ90036.1 hypothetical protein SAMN05443094_104182 [Domibacillus enclensis]